VLRRLRSFLRWRGIEVRRAGSGPRRSLGEVLDHLAGLGLRPGTVVDVGVALGTAGLYDRFRGARLLLVEPLREYEAKLRELGGEYVLAAAGAHAGEIEINVHPVGALSTVVGERRGDDIAVERRTVPVVRVDDLVRERGLPGPYVLKADVEGHELAVVEGAEGILDATEVVLLEVSLFQLVEGAPLLHDVVAAMKDRGFVAYDVYNGHLRPADGALAQLDVAFVREDGRFRVHQDYATPAQAAALYRSWGYEHGG